MSQNYHFRGSSFKKELWIAGKRIFKNLKHVDVEFITEGKWEWVIANSSGAIVKRVLHDGSHGASIDLPSLGLYGDHSIGFRNLSPEEKIIHGGDVTYE